MTLSAFGPGKVILLGEHAVVYGHPALAGPISWGARATGTPAKRCSLKVPAGVTGAKKRLLTDAFAKAAQVTGQPKISVELQSDLPLSMGLGSSAAISVACARLLVKASGSKKPIADVALEMEKVFHGTPSGVDHTTSARGALILYRRGDPPKVNPVSAPKPMKLLIALVGERGSTARTVAALRGRQKEWPRRYEKLFAQIGEIAAEGARACADGDHISLGDLMNINQGLLSSLQVSSGPIDAMVHTLRRHGALGAKLTGAGGDGGAVIGLFLEPEPIVAKLQRAGVRCFGCQIAGPMAL